MRLMHEYQHHFNLIPTPSPLSSFWLLLVCENGGGRSGNSCHVHVDVKTHGWGGGQCPTENLKVLLVISCPRTRDCSVQKTVSIQLVVRLSWGWSRQSLWVATILLSVYLMSSHVVWSPRPSVFAYCKQSKIGAGKGLGTRLHRFINGQYTRTNNN